MFVFVPFKCDQGKSTYIHKFPKYYWSN